MSNSNSNENFDFAGVESASSIKYLKPGVYNLSVSDAKMEKPEGKNPFVQVTFSGDAGSVREKFYITAKTKERIQYLHESIFGKKIEKGFDSAEALGAYLVKALMGKKVERTMLIQGEEVADGRVFTRFGFSGFFLEDGNDYKMGPFEVDSPAYKENVRKSKEAGMLAGNDNEFLPSGSSIPSKEDPDDLPF